MWHLYCTGEMVGCPPHSWFKYLTRKPGSGLTVKGYIIKQHKPEIFLYKLPIFYQGCVVVLQYKNLYCESSTCLMLRRSDNLVSQQPPSNNKYKQQLTIMWHCAVSYINEIHYCKAIGWIALKTRELTTWKVLPIHRAPADIHSGTRSFMFGGGETNCPLKHQAKMVRWQIHTDITMIWSYLLLIHFSLTCGYATNGKDTLSLRLSNSDFSLIWSKNLGLMLV